jgi:plastocyanin domain-containing protein
MREVIIIANGRNVRTTQKREHSSEVCEKVMLPFLKVKGKISGKYCNSEKQWKRVEVREAEWW